jgi:hypothetical protein
VIIRERNGRSLPAVFRTEGQAISFIRSRIAKGTIINADEGSSWDALHATYEMKRVNHEEAYSLDGACTNWAEEFFSQSTVETGRATGASATLDRNPDKMRVRRQTVGHPFGTIKAWIDAGPLFTESDPRVGPGSPATKGSREALPCRGKVLARKAM